MKLLKKNWQTSILGVLTILTTVMACIHDPGLLHDTKTVSGILTGIGLILAKDATAPPSAPSPLPSH